MITLPQESIAKYRKGGGKTKKAAKKRVAPAPKDDSTVILKAVKDAADRRKATPVTIPKETSHAPSPEAIAVVNLAKTMEELARAQLDRKPSPYRFEIHRDDEGYMESVTATPMGRGN